MSIMPTQTTDNKVFVQLFVLASFKYSNKANANGLCKSNPSAIAG